MATTALYATRDRASNRTDRIHRDIQRSSAYILNSDGWSSTGSSSSTRDALRYVDPSNTGYRFRDKFSMEALRLGARKSASGSSPVKEINPSKEQKYNPDFNPYSETARYNREREMKEIHDDFTKTWDATQNKYNGSEDKKSKAYLKIMGSAVSAIEDRDFKRQALGDIFKDMGKFSTKTVAALSTLDQSNSLKPKDYNWRKEIEKYESTGQLEKDARIRSIGIRSQRNYEDSRPERKIQRIESTKPIIDPPARSVVRDTRKSIRREKTPTPALPKKPIQSVKFEDPIEQHPSACSDTSDTKKETIEVKADEKPVVEIPETIEVKAEETLEEPSKSDEAVSQENEEENEDIHGTKKMKDDFSSRMQALDAEMTEGRSNLARIRERIRKAKKGIMEVGEMIDNC